MHFCPYSYQYRETATQGYSAKYTQLHSVYLPLLPIPGKTRFKLFSWKFTGVKATVPATLCTPTTCHTLRSSLISDATPQPQSNPARWTFIISISQMWKPSLRKDKCPAQVVGYEPNWPTLRPLLFSSCPRCLAHEQTSVEEAALHIHISQGWCAQEVI